MTDAERKRFRETRPSEWTDAQKADVAEVIKVTARHDTGISYDVDVSLRSLAASAYEMGEDRMCVWSKCVVFGGTDAHQSGGAAFVRATQEQDAIANEIALAVWGPAT